jgi:hypothetical protein
VSDFGGAWVGAQQAAIRARLAVREAVVVDDVPRMTVLQDNRSGQEAYADRKVPVGAARLIASAETTGFGVRTGWSTVAIPLGYRESSKHRARKEAIVLDVFGVQLAAYGVRAVAIWHLPGGFDHATLSTRREGWRAIGVEALIAYVKGEQP